MNNQSEYMCPICGADGLCTDGFKWWRAYCNSCDCSGPEVRTGYDENLDAPWREEARKQFVEVVNEHVAKRSPWVKTSDRLPTEADADSELMIMAWHIYFGYEAVAYGSVIDEPEMFTYWMPVPPLTEVEG